MGVLKKFGAQIEEAATTNENLLPDVHKVRESSRHSVRFAAIQDVLKRPNWRKFKCQETIENKEGKGEREDEVEMLSGKFFKLVGKKCGKAALRADQPLFRTQSINGSKNLFYVYYMEFSFFLHRGTLWGRKTASLPRI